MKNFMLLKQSLILFVCASIMASLLGTIAGLTHEQRVNQRLARETAVLNDIMPAGEHDNSLHNDTIHFNADSNTGNSTIYVARKNGAVSGFIIPAIAPDGYGGKIVFNIGIYRDGTIAGVRAIEHHETKGLGDRIERKASDWITIFNGKSLQNPLPEFWKVKKDNGVFDQLTGATVTSRASTQAIVYALQFYVAHKDELLAQAENKRVN